MSGRVSVLLLALLAALAGPIRAEGQPAAGTESPKAAKPDAKPATAADKPAEPPCPAEEVCDLPPPQTIDWISAPVDLDALYGQGVLIVFGETWCPVCNKWVGKFAKQVMEEAESRPVTVIFLGVDVAKADFESYLKSHGIEPHASGVVSKLVARQFGFEDTLWRILILDPKGKRLHKGQFGMYRNMPSGDRSAYACDMAKYCEGSEPIVAKSDSPAMKQVGALVRTAQFGKALALLEKAGDEGAETKARLLARGRKILDAALAYKASDAYLAGRLATSVAREFKSAPFGEEAKKLAAELSTEARLRREKLSERALLRLVDMAKRRGTEATIQGGLERLAQDYPDCRAGRLALRALDRPSARDKEALLKK